MKKRTKWILTICLVVLVCAALFIGLILFPVGSNISLLWQMTPHAPGSLPPAWMLPRADNSDIGQTVTLSFPQLLKDSQYDDQDPLNADQPEVMYVVYLEKTGRLAVITEMESNKSLACLTVYEPQWAASEGLFADLTQDFQAKVIHRANINWMEGIIYFGNQLYGDVKEDPSLVIDPAAYTGAGRTNYLYGRFYYGEEEIGHAIEGGITATFLFREPDENDVFLRIAEQYGLNEYLTQ